MKLLATLILVGLCMLPLTAQELSPKKIERPNNFQPAYSAVLFHYYKRNYQAALKALSVISEDNLSDQNKHTHQFLESLLQVINGNTEYVARLTTDSDANINAILTLINEHIELSQWTEAQVLLSSIAEDVPATLRDNYLYLQGLVLLNSKESVADISVSSQSDIGAAWLQQLSSKRTSKVELSNILQSVKSLDEDYQVTKNQALHGLGYQFLSANKPQEAIQSFSEISIDSAVDTSALLGLGLAYNSTNNFRGSRAAFSRVFQADDPSILTYEALLADAYALEQL